MVSNFTFGINYDTTTSPFVAILAPVTAPDDIEPLKINLLHSIIKKSLVDAYDVWR